MLVTLHSSYAPIIHHAYAAQVTQGMGLLRMREMQSRNHRSRG